MHPDRPQAPGYLANLMARLFHEVSGDGLHPLGIRPEQFPILIALWFDSGASRASLADTQEMHLDDLDALLGTMADDGLIEGVPASADANIVLTEKAMTSRDAAVAVARRANQAAVAALGEAEMAQFLALMNRVIDALQAARTV